MVNRNSLSNNHVERPMYPRLLLELLASTATLRSDKPFLTVRFGGWSETHCLCKEAALLPWSCETSSSPLHTYRRSLYEGSFYVGKKGQLMLTGWAVHGPDPTSNPYFTHGLHSFRAAAEHAGYVDAYHRIDKPEWRDDDFYIRLGTLKGCSDELTRELEEHVRGHLATQEPVFIPVRLADMHVVYYVDTSLAEVIKTIPVLDAIQHPELVDDLYRQWASDTL